MDSPLHHRACCPEHKGEHITNTSIEVGSAIVVEQSRVAAELGKLNRRHVALRETVLCLLDCLINSVLHVLRQVLEERGLLLHLGITRFQHRIHRCICAPVHRLLGNQFQREVVGDDLLYVCNELVGDVGDFPAQYFLEGVLLVLPNHSSQEVAYVVCISRLVRRHKAALCQSDANLVYSKSLVAE